MPDDRARLACYDALAGPDPAGAAIAPVSSTATAAQDSPSGQEPRPTTGPPAVVPPDRLESTVSAASRAADGRLVLTLANGQRWQQVDTRRVSIGAGTPVSIRQAALGSYWLATDGRSPGVRVRRVR